VCRPGDSEAIVSFPSFVVFPNRTSSIQTVADGSETIVTVRSFSVCAAKLMPPAANRHSIETPKTNRRERVSIMYG
jgi:hypothetical protein